MIVKSDKGTDIILLGNVLETLNLPSSIGTTRYDGAYVKLVRVIGRANVKVRFIYNQMLANRKTIYEQYKDDKEALKQQKYSLPAAEYVTSI